MPQRPQIGKSLNGYPSSYTLGFFLPLGIIPEALISSSWALDTQQSKCGDPGAVIARDLL